MPSIVLEEGLLLARKYRLRRPAGFGGMAQLWVATNEATGAEICIKILVPEGSDAELVERFRREAYAAARLSHRAIVRIFDLVELGADGEATTAKPTALAIVMELLHGETLGDYLMKKGRLPLDEAIDLALPFFSALAHAHRAGVVHRDLKPDNIFLATDPDGHRIPKVLDFGVSKVAARDGSSRSIQTAALTLDGVMLGTPSYMSPEQARGARDIDARSDVFSAGILLYMMIAGKNPFESENFHSVITAITQREPERLVEVPPRIWEVIEKALAKDPNARYADATELGIALRRAAGRATATDSGAHPIAAVAEGTERTIVPPLGGDSHVSVPPVGNAELADTSGSTPPRTMLRFAQRRAVRIVIAVVAASVALTFVALLRNPAGSRSSASPTAEVPSAAASTASAALPATAQPTASETPTAARSAAIPTAPAAPTAVPLPVTVPVVSADAGTAPKAGSAPGPGSGTVKKKDPASELPTPYDTPSGTIKEPASVRDPGF